MYAFMNKATQKFTGFCLVMGSYCLRVGAGTVVFIVIARMLGPAAFGHFAYWLALATLLAMPVNFGFNALVLRSFGAAPERALSLMAEIQLAKLMLACLPLMLVALGWLWLPVADAAMLSLLSLGQVCESFAEFYLLGFRRRPDYVEESKAASVSAALHMAIMGVTIWQWPDALHAAAGFACSRAIGMLFTRQRCVRCCGKIGVPAMATVRASLQAAWAYALELGLFTVHAQVDSLFINAALGPAALGIYQAGVKLVQGIARFAPVWAQALLPGLARQRGSAGFKREAGRVMLSFALAGAFSGVLLAMVGAVIVHMLFGDAFATLADLLPLFGAMLFLRIAETGTGVVLVASGLQHKKVWLVGLQLTGMLVAGWPVLVMAGLRGWQWLTIASLMALITMYWRVLSSVREAGVQIQAPFQTNKGHY